MFFSIFLRMMICIFAFEYYIKGIIYKYTKVLMQEVVSMIIQKMNNVLVKHSKILFGVITAVIIVSFVWFFTPGVDGSLLFGGGRGENSAYGTFFGEKVTYGEVGEARRQLALAWMGGDVPEEMAFLFAVRGKAADKLGIEISDAELSRRIAAEPMFQENGVFSPEKYKAMAEERLAPMGYSVTDYENALRAFLRTEKLDQTVSANVTLSDAEYKQLLKEKLEKLSFHVIQFTPEAATGEVKVTEEELKAYFESNSADFLPPPQFDGVTASALFADFKPVITEDAKKAYYEKNKDSFKDKDGKVQAYEACAAGIEEALAAADTSKAEKAITDFNVKMRELARTDEYKTSYEALFRKTAAEAGLKLFDVKGINSADTSDTAKLNGTDPSAAAALTNLKRPGSFTNKVRGTEGISISLLLNRKESAETTFAEARSRVDAAYRYTKAAELLPSLSAKFAEEFNKSANKAEDLKTLSGKYHANVYKFPMELSRLFLEQTPGIVLPRGTFTTPEGALSAPSRQSNVVGMIYMEKRTPATEEELKELFGNPDYRAAFLEQKKAAAILEYAYWLQTNCQIVTRQDNGAQQ